MLVLLDSSDGGLLHSIELDVYFHGGVAAVGDYLTFGTGYQNVFFNTTGSLYVARITGA